MSFKTEMGSVVPYLVIYHSLIMTKTLSFSISIAFLIAAFISFSPLALAHEDEHEDADHEVASVAGEEKMEQMIKVLQQLVSLLTEYKKTYGNLPMPAVIHSEADEHAHVETPVSVATDEHEEEHEDEHEEASTSAAQLVIEVEPHMGKTHAHVRYTDKPEAMFFVEADIDDEDAVVAAIVAKIGLSADVVRAALKYMQ